MDKFPIGSYVSVSNINDWPNVTIYGYVCNKASSYSSYESTLIAIDSINRQSGADLYQTGWNLISKQYSQTHCGVCLNPQKKHWFIHSPDSVVTICMKPSRCPKYLLDILKEIGHV